MAYASTTKTARSDRFARNTVLAAIARLGSDLGQGVVVEGIERREQAGADGGGAGGGKLLAADDRGKAGKTRLALAQRRHAGAFQDRLQPRVLPHQRMDGAFEIGLGVEVDGHQT